jgi:hypothetical protein
VNISGCITGEWNRPPSASSLPNSIFRLIEEMAYRLILLTLSVLLVPFGVGILLSGANASYVHPTDIGKVALDSTCGAPIGLLFGNERLWDDGGIDTPARRSACLRAEIRDLAISVGLLALGLGAFFGRRRFPPPKLSRKETTPNLPIP